RAADVGARCDADTAHFRCQGIGNVVTVEVQGGNHAVIRRTHQDLLKEGIGDDILDDDVAPGFRVLHLHPRATIKQLGAKALGSQLIAPVLEGPLGVFHDVALVHQSDTGLVVVDGVLDRLAHQALGTLAGDRLDADTTAFVEADLGDAHFLTQEADQLGRLRTVGGPFDTGVNVFRVLPEDNHVGQLRVGHRAGDTLEPAHRAHAHVEIEFLAQRHVQGADTATDRRGQRSLDADNVLTQRFQGFFQHPDIRAVDAGGFLAAVDFHPDDGTLGAVRLFNGGVDDLDHHRRDIHADTITLDIRNDRMVGHIQGQVRIDSNFVTVCRNHDLLVSHLANSLYKRKTCKCAEIPVGKRPRCKPPASSRAVARCDWFLISCSIRSRYALCFCIGAEDYSIALRQLPEFFRSNATSWRD